MNGQNQSDPNNAKPSVCLSINRKYKIKMNEIRRWTPYIYIYI